MNLRQCIFIFLLCSKWTSESIDLKLPESNSGIWNVSETSLLSINSTQFSNLKHILILDLSVNNLTTLPQNVFRDLNFLKNIYLGRNPWHCDCSILWLSHWLHVSSVITDNPQCATPNDLSGRSLLNLTTSSELGFCNSSCLSKSGKQRESNSLRGNGIQLQYNGTLTKCFYLTINLSGETLTYLITNSGPQIINNNLLLPFADNSYVIAEASNVSFSIGYKDNGFSNCSAYTSTNAGDKHNPYDQVLYNTTACQMKPIVLNVTQNVSIKYKMRSNEMDIAVYLNLSAKSVSKDFSVHVSPNASSKSCERYYEKNSIIIFDLMYEGNSTVNKLYIDDEEKLIFFSRSVSYKFETAGKYDLKITTKILNIELTWKSEVNILESIYSLTAEPKIKTPVTSGSNLTFNLIKRDDCYIPNDQLIVWYIDGSPVTNGTIPSQQTNENSHYRFSYTFPAVGNISRLVSVTTNKNENKITVSVFDAISGFKIVADPGIFCMKTNAQFRLSQSSGSNVSYRYQTSSREDWIYMKGTEVNISFPIETIYNVTFIATNEISEESSIIDVRIVEYFYVELDVQYKEVGKNVFIKPQIFLACYDYEYQWKLAGNNNGNGNGDGGNGNGNSNGNSYNQGEPYSIPKYPFLQQNEAKMAVQLKIKLDNTPSVFNSFVYFEYPITNVELKINDKNNIHINDNIQLTSQITTSSAQYFYRWVVDAVKRPWNIATNGFNPTLNISFSTEAYHEIMIEVKNNVTNKNSALNIFVQYPVAVNISQSSVVAEVGKEFEIVFNLPESKFPYFVKISDDKELTKDIEVKQSSYKFVHVYESDGSYNISFNISDRVKSLVSVIPVRVFTPVSIANVLFDSSIAKKDNTYYLKKGDTLEGKVLYAGTGNVTIHWYLLLKAETTLIAAGSNFSHQFDTKGNCVLKVFIENEISADEKNISIAVEKQQELDLELIYTINKEDKSSDAVAVATNTAVLFTVKKPTKSNTILSYVWLLDGVSQKKAKKRRFNYAFSLQGQFTIQVKATTLYEEKTIGMDVHVQNRLIKGYLIAKCGNTTLKHKSTIPTTCLTIKINHVYFEPTDTKFVSGTITCYQNHFNAPRQILYQTPYKKNLPDGNISVFVLIGYIHCDVSLHNNISQVTTTYSFLKYISPKIKFSDVSTYVKRGSSVNFHATLSNVSVNSTLKWYIGGTMIEECLDSTIYRTLERSASCMITFPLSGAQSVFVVLQNDIENTTSEVITVNVLASIDVYLSPTDVEASTETKIEVQSNNVHDNNYYWPEYKSNSTYIMFLAKEEGFKELTVVVSNQVATKTVKTMITIFPVFNQVEIEVQSFYVKTQSKVSLGSSLTFSKLVYTWFNDSVQLSYAPHSAKITEIFQVSGSYNITLVAASPFRSASSSISLLVIDPIQDLNISLVQVKQDKTTALLAADKLLIGGRNYTFNVTWNNGSVEGELDFLRIANVTRYQYECKKHFCLFDFQTLSEKSHVDIEVTIQNNVSSLSFKWQYDVFPLLENLKPIVSRKIVSMNTILKFWINNMYQKEVKYVWEIGDNAIKFEGPTGSINTSELGRIGRHTIKITATGLLVLNGKVSKTFFITTFSEECDEPSFTDSDFESRPLIKSKWFYVKLSILSACKLTYSWYFEIANKRTDCAAHAQRKIYVSSLMQLNMKKEVLEIPPRYFRTGYYCVRSNITYGTYGIVNKGFLLHVKNSPLIPVLSGGKVRTVGYKQKIVLSTSSTIDPDASYNSKSALFYEWNIVKTCCEGDEGKDVNVTVPYDSRNADALMNSIVPFEANTVYNVQVSIKRNIEDDEGEAFTTSQKIKIIDGTSILIEIICISCRTYKATKYIRNEKLKLTSRCSNCNGLKLQYSWSVIGQTTGEKLILDEDIASSPPNSKLLVVNSEVLDGKQPYTFKLDVKSLELDITGSTSLTIENNISPKNGSCTINPTAGYTLVTKFQVHCAGWSDSDNEEQPFIYWLTYGDLGQNVVFRGAQDRFDVYLPKGNATDDFMVKVNVLVEDSLGAYTVAYQGNIQVMVSPLAKSDPAGFITDTVFPLLDKGITVGDINQVGAAVLASCLLFNGGGGNVKDAYSGVKKSENDSAVLNGLIRGSYSIKPVSIDTIDQVINAQKQVFRKSGLTGITTDNRFQVLQSLKTMLKLADTFSKESVSLPNNARNRFMWLIGNTIEFYGQKEKTKYVGGDRTRRSTDVALKDYNILDNLYKIVLSTTISGEKEVRLTGNSIKTHLTKNSGVRLLGTKSVDKCNISLQNIDAISKLPSSSVQILECSSVNYYDPMMADVYPLLTSITFKDESYKEVEVKNLKAEEKVLISLPTSFAQNDSVVNTYRVKSVDLFVLTFPQLNETVNWRRTGVHVAFDTTPSLSDCSLIVYLSKNVTITVERNISDVFYVGSDGSESNRTIYVKDYDSTVPYYIGIEHTCKHTVEVRTTFFSSSCVYWNQLLEAWDTSGCESTRDTTRDVTVCRCRHLSTFTSNVRLEPNTLDFTVLKKIDFGKNSVALVTCIVVLVIYLIILFFAYKRDKREFKEEHVIPIADSADRFFQYEVRFKTGMFPWAGTTSKVYMKIFGTGCTTQPRPFTHEGNFKRNGLDTFIISVNKSIGKIYKIHVWHDNSGTNPSWYLERVVIRSLVNGEKFFFFCNKWLSLDSVDGSLDYEFFVADKREIKKFSTIFYDFVKRGMSDYHLWLSVFEKPKFSKFTRVQRVTCLVSFVYAWMAVNAMWFQVAPEGDIDIYLGFKGYSFEEIVIAIISVAMVVPLHVLIVLIFRKSSQSKMPQKPLKIWKSTKHDDYSRINVPSYVVDKNNKKVKSVKHKVNDAVEHDDGEFSSLLMKKAKCFDLNELSDFGENDKSRSDLTTLPTKPLVQFMKFPRIPPLHLTHTMEAYITSSDHRDDFPEDYREELILPDIEPDPLLANICVEGVLLDSTEAFEPLIPFSPMLSDEAGEEEDDGFDRKENEELPFDRLLLSSNERYRKKSHKKRYMTESDKKIDRNEKLAKEYGIPDIIEYDACTRWMLPSWCVYIGHLCCFLISAFSILVIITYAEQFGYELAMRWLRVFFIGLAEDIILQYPFLVVLAAAITALFIKPLDLDKIDHFDFVACPHSDVKPNKIALTQVAPPLAGLDLEEAKMAATQQRKYYTHIKKTLFLITLLWCVLCITNISFDPQLSDLTSRNYFKSFGNFSSHHDYTTWLRSIWKSYAYEIDANTTWRTTSTPSIRQLENYHATCDGVKNDTITLCIPEEFRRNNYLGLSADNTDTYTSISYLNVSSLFTYVHWISESLAIPSSIILGNATFYPLSGTARHYRVVETVSNITTDLNELTHLGWLDCRTCTLSHMFTFYQPAFNKYAYVNLLFTQELAGHVTVGFDYRSFRIEHLEQNIEYFSLACIVLLIILTAFMLFSLHRKVRRKGFGTSIQSFSFIHTLFIVLLSLVTCAILIHRVFSWRDFSKLLLDNGHIKDGVIVSEYTVFDEVALHLCGVLSFLVITKVVYILKYFDLYKSVEVISRCMGAIISMIFLHLLVTFIFTLYSVTVFQTHSFSHRTVWSTFMSILCRRWEKPTRDDTFKIATGHAAFMELLWTVYWLIIPINIFRAILIEGMRERREIVEKSHDLFAYFVKFFYQPDKKDAKSSGNENIDEEPSTTEGRETDQTEISQAEPEPALPTLPIFDDIDKKISELMGRLERKTTEEVWEEERVVRIAHRLNTVIQ